MFLEIPQKALSSFYPGAIIALSGLSLPNRAHAASEYTLLPVQYGMELKAPNGQVVFEYMIKKPEDIGLTAPSAAYFHPVNTPSGERISNVAPDDHPHHRGIWLGFMDSEFHEPFDFSKFPPPHSLRGYLVRRGDFWP
jgi:hypothetical protein